MGARDEEELYAQIDRESVDERERNGSKAIYQALKQHRDDLGGAARIPRDDAQLSERILAQARTRSAEVAAVRRSAGGIPWWLWLAWAAAVAGFAAAWIWLK